MFPVTIRKRTITNTDIVLIQDTVDAHWNKGRNQIGKLLHTNNPAIKEKLRPPSIPKSIQNIVQLE